MQRSCSSRVINISQNSKSTSTISSNHTNPLLDENFTKSNSMNCTTGTVTASRAGGEMKRVSSRCRMADIETIKASIETTDSALGKTISNSDLSSSGSRTKSFLNLGMITRTNSQATVGSRNSEFLPSLSHKMKKNNSFNLTAMPINGKEVSYTKNEEINENSLSNYMIKSMRNIGLAKGVSVSVDTTTSSIARESYQSMLSASLTEANKLSSTMRSIGNQRSSSRGNNSSMTNIEMIMNSSTKHVDSKKLSDESILCSSLQFRKFLESSDKDSDINFMTTAEDDESDSESVVFRGRESTCDSESNSVDSTTNEEKKFFLVGTIVTDSKESNGQTPLLEEDIRRESGKRRGVSKTLSASVNGNSDENLKASNQSFYGKSRRPPSCRRRCVPLQNMSDIPRARSLNSIRLSESEGLTSLSNRARSSHAKYEYQSTNAILGTKTPSTRSGCSSGSKKSEEVYNGSDSMAIKKKRQQNENEKDKKKPDCADDHDYFFKKFVLGATDQIKNDIENDDDEISTLNSSFHSSYKDFNSSIQEFQSSFKDLHSSYDDFDADEDVDLFCVAAVTSDDEGDIIMYEDYWKDIDNDTSSKYENDKARGSQKSQQLKPKRLTLLTPAEKQKERHKAPHTIQVPEKPRRQKRRGQRKPGTSMQQHIPRQQDLSQSVRSLFSTNSNSSSMSIHATNERPLSSINIGHTVSNSSAAKENEQQNLNLNDDYSSSSSDNETGDDDNSITIEAL